MKYLGRLTVGLLWIVLSTSITAGTIWIEGDHGDAGATLDTAQMIHGHNDPLNAIRGHLSNIDGVDIFRILISHPGNFSAEVEPDPHSTSTQVLPQFFLFDSSGSPIVGALGFFVADATLPFGPKDPGYYFLAVDSIGHDPFFTKTNADGTEIEKPLFCPDSTFADAWVPCKGAKKQQLDGFQGQVLPGTNTGAYEIFLTGVTAPNPEPESVILMLTGLAVVLTAARKKRRSTTL